MMLDKNIKIYVAGHNGMVGSSCVRLLNIKGYKNIIFKSFSELDLRDQFSVNEYIKFEKPDVIIDAAAKVGGILANSLYPYDFLIDNMQIQNNLISAAHEHNISKFIFLGSSCIYPKFAPQPLKEDYLLTDVLEPTNEWYAIAKISGVKLIESLRKQFNRNYVSLMPTNLYGPNDNFDLQSSHVLPAMIRKFHESKINGHTDVTLWGSGSPKREFLHVDDLAEAVIYAMENKMSNHLYNVGSGEEISIKELSKIIKKITGHKGEINWDSSKPDGTPRKLLDCDRIFKLGWKSSISLENGIQSTYEWYKKSY